MLQYYWSVLQQILLALSSLHTMRHIRKNQTSSANNQTLISKDISEVKNSGIEILDIHVFTDFCKLLARLISEPISLHPDAVHVCYLVNKDRIFSTETLLLQRFLGHQCQGKKRTDNLVITLYKNYSHHDLRYFKYLDFISEFLSCPPWDPHDKPTMTYNVHKH